MGKIVTGFNWEQMHNLVYKELRLQYPIEICFAPYWELPDLFDTSEVLAGHCLVDFSHFIYVREELWEQPSLANHTILHELAHAVQIEFLGPAKMEALYPVREKELDHASSVFEIEADEFADEWCTQVKVFELQS